ncbi:MAG TPA: hypothetical protein VGD45_33375 [Steroidobacter sp.]|uniref:hypothetical protein n=1 Tax=Steroidobacter sp. TaxID=1978227 RepID=UPI002ED96264
MLAPITMLLSRSLVSRLAIPNDYLQARRAGLCTRTRTIGGDGRKVATVAGAVIGAVIGGNIGRRMDRADDGCAYQAFEFASPRETIFWRNPDSQIKYGITPERHTSQGRSRMP